MEGWVYNENLRIYGFNENEKRMAIGCPFFIGKGRVLCRKKQIY